MSHSLITRDAGMLARAFPTPKYLVVPAAGINVSDYSIKHMLLERQKDEVVLVAHGKTDLPLGTVERGEIKDTATLTRLLVKIREDTGYRYVHLALPEEHAYLFQINLAKGEETSLEQMLEFRLKENVPLGADEALFDYNVLHEDESSVDLNVSVYPKAIVEQYRTAFHDAGLVLLSAEIEGQATARALLPIDHTSNTLILDIGRNEASLSISTNGAVIFTASLEAGGDLFTRAIARGLNLSFQEAERLKREYGFRELDNNKVVFEAFLASVSEFEDMVRRHLMYWQIHTGENGNEEEAVSQIILAGGNANIVGLPEHLEATLGIPVSIGNVWANLYSFDTVLPDISASESLEFATAVGLAIRSVLRDG